MKIDLLSPVLRVRRVLAAAHANPTGINVTLNFPFSLTFIFGCARKIH